MDIRSRTWNVVFRLSSLGNDWRCAPAALMVVLTASLLAACGGGGSAAPAEPTTSSANATVTLEPTHETTSADDDKLPTIEAKDDFDKPCKDDVISVAELAKLDGLWQSALEERTNQAKSWQSDATLVQGSVMCFFAATPDIDLTFKSETAQEARTFPDDDRIGRKIQTPIDTSLVLFSKLHDYLIAAGLTDDTLLVSVEMSDVYTPNGADPANFYYRVTKYETADNGEVFVI